jgi:hypothetical protein
MMALAKTILAKLVADVTRAVRCDPLINGCAALSCGQGEANCPAADLRQSVVLLPRLCRVVRAALTA